MRCFDMRRIAIGQQRGRVKSYIGNTCHSVNPKMSISRVLWFESTALFLKTFMKKLLHTLVERFLPKMNEIEIIEDSNDLDKLIIYNESFEDDGAYAEDDKDEN